MGYDDLLPYYRRSEHTEGLDMHYRGVDGTVPGMPGAELAADIAPLQNVVQEPVHVLWLPPRLENSATTISATVVTNHSSGGTACCKYTRRVYSGLDGERRTARREMA
jgi:hypothetical protein